MSTSNSPLSPKKTDKAHNFLSYLKDAYKPRVEFDPITEGENFQRLSEFYSLADIARTIGVSRPFISKRISLLKLIPELKEHVKAGKVSLEPAYALSLFSEKKQRYTLEKIQILIKEEPKDYSKSISKLVAAVKEHAKVNE